MIYEDYKFAVIRADKLDLDVRLQMSEIFAEGFTQWLVFFSKDKNIIAKAFAHMFVLDQFYVAVTDNKIAGMVACTDCRTLSVRLNKKELRKYLGFFKGSIAAIALKKEFERTFKNPPPETGSIEFVGTAVEFRGKRVATQIINYIISNTPYREYLIEEVADSNISAMNLYKKLGFKEYKRIPVPQKRVKKIGINNFIALKYIK
ncbi:acetyltransferase (GNAT) family protein [Mobilisporobacter senegalensis]|uniref:Acetyltransferase (GNAT) family protein n=1 Tax=Mobilisporobacter senegalensis TaxID=1329262 RepID=A0A3N1XZ99_9FIRM|nr:GNAT family N-acetyltransferase [Mobilisporobacter senegalensis]ROR30582.1 acetyltransferase (GNAT) family protein [Mobilisporobacter senegalensis]